MTGDEGAVDLNVDISNEDVPDEEEIGRDGESVRDQALEEARRVLSAANGETETERARNALNQKRRSVESFTTELQQVSQRIGQLEQRKDGLGHTIERLDEINVTFFQSLSGGVIVPVPRDREDEVVGDIEDALEQAENELESAQERAKAVERGLQKSRIACEFLSAHGDLSDGDS